MLAAHLALAFTFCHWPERRKASLWEQFQTHGSASLGPQEHRELDGLIQHQDKHLKDAANVGARMLLPGDPGTEHLWPRLPYPLALWVRGTLPPRTPCLTLVGTRRPSPRGKARARSWARTCTSAGVGVLSGLARGIDAAAHEGALEVGPTWGVMGSGLRHPYPPEHRDLMDRMVGAGGGVIAPFPPEAPPHPWHFPRRNLFLAAWALGVVVLEANLKSGSLITARLALDLGRDVWACPGSPEDPLAEGPNALLRAGSAFLARDPKDILEDLLAPRGLTEEGDLSPSSQAWSLP